MQLETGRQIDLTVNGERTATEDRTLAALVARLGFAENQVATALNGDFVPRSKRAATSLQPGDEVEILAPRQGG